MKYPSVKMSSTRWYCIDLNFNKPAEACEIVVLTLTKLRNGTSRNRGWDSEVGIATRYGLDGSRIESQSGRYFPHTTRPPMDPAQPPLQWAPALSQAYSCRAVTLTDHSI
jgi:hypothetical protein